VDLTGLVVIAATAAASTVFNILVGVYQ